MPLLNPELELELNLDVDKVFNYLVRLLRNRNITQYIENHPAAYNEVLAAVQEIPQPKPLPTPASTPREKPDTDGQADQYKSNLVNPHGHGFPAAKQELSQRSRPLYHAYVEDADDFSIGQTSDNSPPLADLNLWPLFDHNDDTHNKDAHQEKQSSETIVTFSIPERPDTLRHTSSKRKQHFEDSGAAKRVRIELADATVNLTNTRLNHCAIMIQKNLKAKYYRRKYLETRNAIILIQFVTRRFLAWKHTQETRKITAATAIQRVWRGQKQRKSFNAIRNHVLLIQAVAKGFLRRGEIMDTRFRKAAVLIQRLWHLRREYKRKVVIVQNLWRGKCARRRYEKIREADRFAELPTHWRTQLQRIKSVEVVEDCQRFCYMIRHPVTSIDVRPDKDALERSGGPDKIPTRDRRLKQVKFILEDGWAKKTAFDIPKIVLQVSRKIHLVELTARYMEDIEAEKATSKKWRTKAKKTASKKRRRPTVKERYVDLLFPHTIEYKGKKTRKRKKRQEGKGRKRSAGEWGGGA